MKELLKYVIKGITASSDFSIEEHIDNESDENSAKPISRHVSLVVKAKPSIIGLIIGKEGKTVRAIRNLVRVLATLEKNSVSLSVEEK